MPQTPHSRPPTAKGAPTPAESTTDGLATMAHETMDRVAETANRAGTEMRAAATRTAETTKHAQERAVAAADANLRRVRSYVGRNPLTAVGIALAVGALLTALVRR